MKVVFRFLRCGLTDITEEEMDRLENYVIAMGIRGLARWEQEWSGPIVERSGRMCKTKPGKTAACGYVAAFCRKPEGSTGDC